MRAIYWRMTIRPSLRSATLLFGSLALVSCAPAARAPTGSLELASRTTVPAITAEDLRRRLFLIAHDSMLGRETGSEGAFKTAAYVAAEFERLGLEPAGEEGTYFQVVPFWHAEPDPASRLTVNGESLAFGRDFVPVGFPAPPRTLDDVPVVYGGHADDSSSMIPAEQAEGKVVVLDLARRELAGRVGFERPQFARAALIVGVQLELVAPELLARVRDGRALLDTTRNPQRLQVVWVTRRAATLLLGADPQTLKSGAPGRTVSGYV